MDYYYFLIFVLATPLFFFLFQWYMKAGWGRNRPPGPPGLPFIGNLHQLDSSPLYHQLWKLSIKYGPLVSLQLGFTPVLVVSSPKMAKEALKTHDTEFANRPPSVSFKKLSYNGLDVAFAPYNDSWKEMRKICILHLFSPKRVQSFHPVREEEVSKMIKKIEKCASDSRIVNLSELLLLFANTNICRIAFGKNYDDDDESSERSKFENLLSDSQAVSSKFYLSDYFPYLGWVDRLTGESGRLEKTFKELDAFLQELVDEHISDGKRSNKFGQDDFIDVLLQLKKDGSSTINLTFDHIKAILLDIFTAGTDTNTATLVWAMTELIKNPNTMKKAQQEVRNIGRNNGAIEENDLQKCPYLQAVVKETLRLHPPAPLLVPHQTTQKCNIFGYEIPPKTVVHVNAWAIGRDPESWEDPERFSPERFLGNSIDFRGRDFELIPFGAGRRGCPGIHMGVVTVEFALANLLYYFNWELPDGMKREEIDTYVKPGITMHKKNPLCLIPRKWSGNLDE